MIGVLLAMSATNDSPAAVLVIVFAPYVGAIAIPLAMIADTLNNLAPNPNKAESEAPTKEPK